LIQSEITPPLFHHFRYGTGDRIRRDYGDTGALAAEDIEALADGRMSLPAGLTVSQRVRFGNAIERVFEQRRQARSETKASWIAAARAATPAIERQPCAVCGKYLELCDAHHVVPLHIQYSMGLAEPSHDLEWLCPTHHRAVHRGISAVNDQGRAYFDGLPPEEHAAVGDAILRFIKRQGALSRAAGVVS
jgi:hypothetical protein